LKEKAYRRIIIVIPQVGLYQHSSNISFRANLPKQKIPALSENSKKLIQDKFLPQNQNTETLVERIKNIFSELLPTADPEFRKMMKETKHFRLS